MSEEEVIVPRIIERRKDGDPLYQFEIKDIIGKGGFATVYRVEDLLTHKFYALKVTPKSQLEKPKLMEKHLSEVKIQMALSHPNILSCYDYFEDHLNTYMLLEYCPKGSVKHVLRKIGRFSEPEAALIIRQIVDAIVYLHDNRIIHRDLKLENYLVGQDGFIKVADFGLSIRLSFDDEKRFSVCGTPNYISPEVISSQKKGHSYEVDIWAIGVSAFVLLTGRTPFETGNVKEMYRHIKACSYRFPPDIKLGFTSKDFIQSVLQIKPELRPSAQELSLHPFLALADKAPSNSPQSRKRPIGKTPIFPEENFTQIQLEREKNKSPKIAKGIENESPPNQNKGEVLSTFPDYAVTRYCDYSSKYGLIYLLGNGCVGACFLDSTRMILDPFEKFLQYWPNYTDELPVIMKLTDKEESRKISIIMKLAKTLKNTSTLYKLPKTPFLDNIPMRNVKYWIKDSEATLFRMDNRLIQVNFEDKKKVLINWNEKKLMVVSSIHDSGKMIPWSDLSKVEDAKKRFLHAKELLNKLSS